MVQRPTEEEFDIEANLILLEKRLARLRILYEQYFVGIEKRPPTTALKEVVRLLHRLESEPIRKTALKFRLNSLSQKYNSYRSYWLRVDRQIENGTYIRHKQKVRNKINREEEIGDEIGNDLDQTDDAIEDEVPREQPQRTSSGTGASEAAALADAFLNELRGGPPSEPRHLATPSRSTPQARDLSPEEARRRDEKLRALKEKLGMDPDANIPPPPTPSAALQGSSPILPGAESSPRIATPAGVTLAPPPSSATSTPRMLVPQRGAPGAATPGQTPRTPGVLERRAPTQPTPAPAQPASEDRSALKAAGISEDRLNSIYNSLVDARRRCKEDTGGLSIDSVARSIAKQAPTIMKKHNASGVDFQVVIKDGRAYLKPVPK